MKKLVYLPIDIDVEWPNEELLLKWFDEHKLLDTDYWEYAQGRHIWAMISTCKQPKDWRRYDGEMWANRREEGDNEGVLFHPGFEETFPSIANCIRQLPFKQLTVSGMLYQLGPIPDHQDTFDPRTPTEPRRYTIYLTDPAHNTFYFSKEKNGERHFPTMSRPCFAFNNNDVWHGAAETHRPKIILTTAGIIDDEKHEALLKRSLEKYGSEAMYL